MTQGKLVNIVIDILIHGEYITNGAMALGNKKLWMWGYGHLDYFNHRSGKEYPIYFNKKIKNMAMLCVLLRDWSNENDYYKNWYRNWIENGAKE